MGHGLGSGLDHGVDTGAIAVVAASVILWGLVSARLERWNITAPTAFVGLGLVVTRGPFALVDVQLHSSTVRGIAEITLALVLFVDASRVNASALRADAGLSLRLLGIGLPLTIGFGFVVAMGLYGGSWWVAALIGAAVAPTDAALGAPVMQDTRVPGRIRRILNVESGLNDGIVTPFVSFFIAGAAAAEAVHGAQSAAHALVELVGGVGIGIAVGVIGALLLRAASAHRFSAPAFRPFAVLGLALFAYAAAIEAGANGFVATFVSGMAFGSLIATELEPTITFTNDAGELLSLLVWFLFGATMLVPAFRHFVWEDLAFAVLALTVVRMLPVAVALLGAGLDRRTASFVGWFGPRGLASVVFALLAVDALDAPEGNRVLAAVTITVLLSVVAHGVSASPLSARYGASAAALHEQGPEHVPLPDLRTRSFLGHRRHRTGHRDVDTDH